VVTVSHREADVTEVGSRPALLWLDFDGDDERHRSALLWFDDLCGHPHKSAYADSRVMPT
jgi:hypothetical protein